MQNRSASSEWTRITYVLMKNRSVWDSNGINIETDEMKLRYFVFFDIETKQTGLFQLFY